MGILIGLADLSERVGNNTATFTDKLAENVRLFSCNLWSSFPDQITQNKSLASSFARGFMNNMCADQPLPPAPTVPFMGGQCVGVQYRLRFNIAVITNGTLSGWSGPGILGTNIAGPITSISLLINNVGTVAGLEHWSFQSNGIPPIDGNSTRNYTFRVTTEDGTIHDLGVASQSGVQFIDVVRADGQPDLCGNPDESYPETSPQPNDYTTIVNILSEDNSTQSYPLEYKPTNFSFPLNFDLGGVNVEVNLGGINFNFSAVSIDGVPIPLPDGQESPIPIPSDDENRRTNCIKRLPPNSTNYNEDDKTETDPKEEDVGETLEFVRVTLTSVPTNVKNQFGDGAPDVVYAGWFEFQGEGYNFPRQPIHFMNSIFIPPEGATGYAYTLYEGILGKATVYTVKEDN